MPFLTQGKTNWKFLLTVIILAIIVGGWALWVSKKEISTIQIFLPKTQKEISEQKVLELENQILESKFGSKIVEFTIIKKITTPSLESCPDIEDYTQDRIWFSEGFPDIKGFRDYAIEGFIGINGEFICLYANRRGPGSGTPPLIPIDSFYNQVTTADWKTYRNEEYRYEIKYPADWEVSLWPAVKGVNIKKENCNFDIREINKGSYDEKERLVAEGCNSKQVVVNDISFTHIICPAKGPNRYYTQKDSKYFQIEPFDQVTSFKAGEPIPSSYLSDCWKYFNQMLSTFRFLE